MTFPPLRAWLWPALLACLFFVALAVRAGSADGFRYLQPIHAGSRFLQPAVLLAGQRPLPDAGYDGQFYFAIAQDPLLARPETAASLDGSFRYRRILYPLLAWAVSGGQRALVPFALMAVNVVACCGIAVLLAWYAARRGVNPWSSLVVSAFPGLWIPLLFDLTEPTHLALLAGGVIAGSTGLLLLSALAKETAAVVLLVQAGMAAWSRRWRLLLWTVGAVAALAAWSLFAQLAARGARQGALAFAVLDPPGAPFLVLAKDLRGNPANFVLAGLAVLVCLLALGRLLQARDRGAWAAAAYAVAVLASGADVWVALEGYFRIMAGVVVLVYVSWCAARDAIGTATLAAAGLADLIGLAALFVR